MIENGGRRHSLLPCVEAYVSVGVWEWSFVSLFSQVQ